MNRNLVNIIKQIIADNGEGVLADPPRMKAFFSDLTKEEPKPLRVAFGRCIEEGAYNILKNAQDAEERTERKAEIAQRVRDEHGLDVALCAEALDVLETAIFAGRKKPPRCPYCGKELQEEWKACPYCGVEIGVKKPGVKATPLEVQSPLVGYTAQAPVTPVVVNAVSLKQTVKKNTSDNVLDYLAMVGFLALLVFLFGYISLRNSYFANPTTAQQSESAAETVPKPAVSPVQQPAMGRLVRTLYGHGGGVSSVVYSPDGRHIASASYDGTVKIWDAERGQEIRTLSGHGDGINSVAYRPDGRRIVTGSIISGINVWDAENGKQIINLFENNSVQSVVYSPNGRWIASASGDKTIKIWDAESRRIIHTLYGYNGYGNSVTYSPDGKCIISASFDKTVKVWNAESGQEIRTLSGHSFSVASVTFSPDGQRILSASYDAIKIWNTNDGHLISTVFCVPDYHPFATSFSRNMRPIVLASFRNVTGNITIKILDAENGRVINTLVEHSDRISSAAYSPDGKYVVSASNDNTVKIWDVGD